MPPPLPRRSVWAYCFAHSPSRISLPRKGSRVGLHIVLFEACSAFTRVAACTLALSPIRDTLIEGFSHFVTSMTAPIASGWSGCRVGLAPTGKRRLFTAHTQSGHPPNCIEVDRGCQGKLLSPARRDKPRDIVGLLTSRSSYGLKIIWGITGKTAKAAAIQSIEPKNER